MTTREKKSKKMAINFSELKQVRVTPGELVRAFRNNFKITLQDLEVITGIKKSNLSAIENNKVELGVRRAVLLAAALGLEPEDILFPNGYEVSYAKEVKAVRVAAEKYYAKKNKK